MEGILPQFLGIIVLIGVLLAVFDPKTIQKFIGSSSGWWGTLLASAIGSITLIPGSSHFPPPRCSSREGLDTCRSRLSFRPS